MRTHGGSHNQIYRVWASMLQRCTNPNARGFYNYGGRGIRVCDRWKKFAAFMSDMGDRPIGTSLDRVDNDGDYKPSNRRQQASNRRDSVYITFRGRTKHIDEWATEYSLTGRLIYIRLRRGWDVERAITTPIYVAPNACRHGHTFTTDNTYVRSNGTRSCRACHAAQAKRSRTRISVKQEKRR